MVGDGASRISHFQSVGSAIAVALGAIDAPAAQPPFTYELLLSPQVDQGELIGVQPEASNKNSVGERLANNGKVGCEGKYRDCLDGHGGFLLVLTLCHWLSMVVPRATKLRERAIGSVTT
ncbi:hypothetical protein D3C81_1891180 [compost metagenome]